MKKTFIQFLAFGLLSASSAIAQDVDDQRNSHRNSDKISEYDEIIIKQKDKGKDGKVVVEVRDGEVIVNGKPLDKFDDKNIIVTRRSPARISINGTKSPFRNQEFLRSDIENRAFLGVTTQKTDDGVKVQTVSDNSSAEKAGIKSGDIITKLNEKTIANPEQLSEVVSTYKPEEKVTVTLKRSGKEMKLNAVLGKREAPMAMSFRGMQPMEEMRLQDFSFDMPGDNLYYMTPNVRPRLGLRGQDTEDGKGVKVLDVDDESPADKAGLKEDDIIVSIEGKPVNSADELAAAYKDNKDKNPMKISVLRDGKSTELEVKIPKKLKTANL